MSDISVQETALETCVDTLNNSNKPYFLYFITATELDVDADNNKLYYASYGQEQGTPLTELKPDDIEKSVEESLTGKINDNIRFLYNKKFKPEKTVAVSAANTAIDTAVKKFVAEPPATGGPSSYQRRTAASGGVQTAEEEINLGGSRSMKHRRRHRKKNKNTKRRSRK